MEARDSMAFKEERKLTTRVCTYTVKAVVGNNLVEAFYFLFKKQNKIWYNRM